MAKVLNSLHREQCGHCCRLTLVRERFDTETGRTAQVCARCVPIDGRDMTHQSSKLVVAGY